MSKPRNYQTEALVIKKTKLGEADRILNLYTPKLGKIQAVAKGVRRPRSKMSGHLELITHSLISLARGRNIDTVTNTRTITAFLPLKSDLLRGGAALYTAELVDRFTADHIENEPLFKLLLATWHRLAETNDIETALRFFELHLLETVGYRPELDRCVVCKASSGTAGNWFSPMAGGVLCPACSSRYSQRYPVSPEALNLLRILQKDEAETLPARISPTLARELAALTGRYLEYLLEREIKSARWLSTLRFQLNRNAATQSDD
jgi:DNA repair protein RecO (recombination protein O)